MRVILKNIGLISSADIEVNSLTVITGVNDTGKSTIGKMLFSIIKAFRKYEEDLGVGEQDRIRASLRIYNNIFHNVRKELSSIVHNYQNTFANDQLDHINKSDYTTIHNYIGKLDTIFTEVDNLLRFLRSQKNLKAEDLDKLSSKLSEIVPLITDKSICENIENDLHRANKILHQKENKEDLIKKALKKALVSEFYSEISFNGKSEVTYLEAEKEFIHFEIENDISGKFKNTIGNFRSNGDIFFDESTIIESPIILQLYDVLKYANTIFELEDKEYSLYRNRGKVPFHTKDLMSKLERVSYFSDIGLGIREEGQRSLESYSNKDDIFLNNEIERVEVGITSYDSIIAEEEQVHYLISEISKIIDGDVSYSKKNNDFIFNKKINGVNHQIKSINTATGIKAFGILQLLLKLDILNERHLLIIDEPESHLHPEWQLEYAKIILKLAKYGIPVLVTTHSPYMVQALSYYSNKESLSEVKFYFAEKNNELSYMLDVSDDLRIIFEKLSRPLEEVVFE
jgi:energy-coupling factor transporter ATP-binding protein EcfA2